MTSTAITVLQEVDVTNSAKRPVTVLPSIAASSLRSSAAVSRDRALTQAFAQESGGRQGGSQARRWPANAE